jgi:hypothetical protein
VTSSTTHRGGLGRRILLAGAAAALSACWGLEAPPATNVSGNDGRLQHGGPDATGTPVVLRDAAGNPIQRGSLVPYSPQQTCGGTCHDVATITQGYHFQQGRTNADRTLRVSDAFNPAKRWLLSDGMYGKT